MRRFLLSLCLLVLPFGLGAVQRVQISEFLATNVRGLPDQDGDPSDWLELYNPNPTAVDLGGWHLTDDAANLTKWTFPSTNLGPGGFLLVFASGKDRAVAGGELHANFQLDGAGEYLALVRPDGFTVEFAYEPVFPPQAPSISFGTTADSTLVKFITEGKAARWRVPAGPADMPADWVNPGFDDTQWQSGFVPLGFDAGQILGVSGPTTNYARGRTATQSSTSGAFNAGLAVDGNTNNFTHTLPAIRTPATWEVNLGTNVLIDEITLYNRGDGCCGSRLRDITVPVMTLDNRSTNFTSVLLNPENVLGGGTLAGPASISISLKALTGAPVLGGRVRVTRTPDPDLSGTGGQGNADEIDVLSLGEVVVSSPAPALTYRSMVRSDIQPAMLGINASALVRVPFLVLLEDLPALESLVLRMKYDDGFVAYLNGFRVASANAPGIPAWNSAASDGHPDVAAIAFEEFDISSYKDLLQDGINVLAIQGLNLQPGDDDFLLSPELVGTSAGLISGSFFTQPTPGAANLQGSAGLVADTKFSVDRGFFGSPFSVEITTATPGAEIRYTTNGSAPSAVFGIVYTGPIQIDRTTVLRAIATKPGFTPSDVDTQTYIFPGQVVNQSQKSATAAGFPASWGGEADYAMDPRITTNAANAALMTASLRSLPTVCFSSSISNFFDAAKGFYANSGSSGVAWERPASMEMIGTNGTTEFQENCGIRVQGGYFRDPNVTQKHSLRVLFKSQYGTGKLRHDLFKTDDAVTEFDTLVLRAGANDGYAWGDAKDTEQFIRNRFGGDLNRAMGNVSTHGMFVHVYLNGLYWGIYELTERPNEDFSASYFGGDPLEWDSNNAGDIKNGDLGAWNIFNNQTSTAKTVAAYERMQGNNPDGSRNTGYPVYFDRQNYIDYMVANIWGGNWDWPNKNFWFGRDRSTNSTGFKFYMWDFENTMGNNRDRSPVTMVSPRDGTESSWVGQPHFYLKTLGEYKMDFADRVQRHFFNGGALTPSALIQRYGRLASTIELAMLCETARWGDDNLSPPQDIDDWRREREWILGTYLPQRSDVVLKQFRASGLFPSVGAPSFSQFGGTVPPGFSLALSHTNATGQIYFTVNGSDPRMIGGGLSPSAQPYGGPIPINGNTYVRARVLSSTNWSPIVEAPFTTADFFRDLVVSEIMYNPPGQGALGGDEFEFLELRNTGASLMDLGGLSFTSGITCSFTNGTLLPPGGSFLLARNPAAMQSRYPGVVVNGLYSGTLSNGGETLTLAHSVLGVVFSFAYDDAAPWPLTPDGLGFSLVLRNPGSGEDPGDAPSWRASTASGGSPGATDPDYTLPKVVINEVMSRRIAGLDFIELFNTGPAPALVGGWFLTDDPAVPRKYRIPSGTLIEAGGFFAITEEQFDPAGSTNAFGLNAAGDQAYLFSADEQGALTGYTHGFQFGAAAPGVSFGRHVLSTGAEDFPAQVTSTPGSQNTGPRIGPVVISEIQYHPLAGDDSFLEIRNISGVAQPLYDPAYPTNTWRLGGLGFAFPQGVTLQPGEFALITDATPELFRSRHPVPAEVRVFGPVGGTFQHSGELLELERPDVPGASGVDYIVVDAVRYNDRGGWSSAADGAGPSLQRNPETGYGNDPSSWLAARPTPGSPWTGGSRPAITRQPSSAVSLAGTSTNFLVSALSGEALSYQWRYDGAAIPGATSPLLLLSNVQPAQAGRYSVVVSGGGGAVVSSNVFLTVLVPASIVSQPRSAIGLFGSNVTFSVTAISSTPLTFQWRFNGADIPAATGSSLTLRNLSFLDNGDYTCRVTDGVGSAETLPATLTVVVKPSVVVPPLNLEVPAGGTATFSAVAEGTLPLTFRWRRNAITFTNQLLNQKVALLVLTNVQIGSAGRYSVLVTNVGGQSPATSEAILTVLPDTDADGMPDNWETQYGLNPAQSADAGLDADGDGMSNRAEYIAGTDPKDALSYLRVDQIQGTTNTVSIEFMARSNRTYSVQYRALAGDGLWQVLSHVAARSSNRVERVVDPSPSDESRYYRLGTPAGVTP